MKFMNLGNIFTLVEKVEETLDPGRFYIPLETQELFFNINCRTFPNYRNNTILDYDCELKYFTRNYLSISRAFLFVGLLFLIVFVILSLYRLLKTNTNSKRHITRRKKVEQKSNENFEDSSEKDDSETREEEEIKKETQINSTKNNSEKNGKLEKNRNDSSENDELIFKEEKEVRKRRKVSLDLTEDNKE